MSINQCFEEGCDDYVFLTCSSQCCYDLIVRSINVHNLYLCYHSNARHWTPMDCAAYKGWDRTVQLLIEFEADIDPKDKAGVRERNRETKRES